MYEMVVRARLREVPIPRARSRQVRRRPMRLREAQLMRRLVVGLAGLTAVGLVVRLLLLQLLMRLLMLLGLLLLQLLMRLLVGRAVVPLVVELLLAGLGGLVGLTIHALDVYVI